MAEFVQARSHLKGFHTRYSFFSPSAPSTLTLFSLYTLQGMGTTTVS